MRHLQKNMGGGVDFLLADKQVFYKLLLLLWVCGARHAQSPKVTSLQYLCNIQVKLESTQGKREMGN